MAGYGKKLPFIGGGGGGGSAEGSSGLSVESARQSGSDDNEASGTIGQNEGPSIAGTIDLAAVSAKRRKGGRPRLTIAERRARAKARAENRGGGPAEAPEEVAVDDGRPPPEVKPEIIQNVAMMLQFVHGAGAWALSNDDAEMLAKAATNVGRYYVKLSVSAKGQAWGALAATAAMVYFPKLMLAAAMRRAGGGAPPVDIEAVARAATVN